MIQIRLLRLLHLLLIGLLLSTVCRADPAVDPNPNIEIQILDGTDAQKDALRNVDPSNPAEVAAEAEMRRALREEYAARRHASDAVNRLNRFRQSPLSERFALSENGKIMIVIDMTADPINGGAHASTRMVGADNKAYVKMSGSGLDKMAPGSEAKLRTYIAEVLAHEFDHLNLMLSEADYVVRYKMSSAQRLWWNYKAFPTPDGSHSINTTFDPVNALVEGLAEAVQLHHFKSQSYIYEGFRTEFFTGGLWSAYRKHLPLHKRILVRMAELSKSLPGSVGNKFGFWVEQRYGVKGWNDPILADQRGPEQKVVTLKSYQQMLATEGVVALLLTDLYDAGLATPEQMRDLINKTGANTLETLVEQLKSQTSEPSVKARIDAVKSRRLMGADVDFEKARSLFERRMSGRITPEEYSRDLNKMIQDKIGTQHGQQVVMAELPAQEPVGGAVKLRPAARIRALIRAAGNSEMMRGQVRFLMAFFVAHYAIALISGRGSKDPVENMREALKQVMSPEFLASAGIFMASNTATQGGLNAAARVASNSRALATLGPRIARVATANAKFGGPLGILVAGFLTRQILAHDYSFWACDQLPFGDKLKRTLEALADFSQWDKKAVLELALGTAGFAVVMAIAVAAGAPTAGIGAVVVLAVAIVGSFLAALLADPISNLIDTIQYSNICRSIRFAINEFKSPTATADAGWTAFAWLHMDDVDKQQMSTTTSVDQKQTLMAHALGTVGEKTSVRFVCGQGNVAEKTRAVTAGMFKEFIEKRDGWTGKVLGKMNEVMASKQGILDEAQKELDAATNPLREGVDARKLAILFAWDRTANRLSPAEIADYIVYGIVTDEATNKNFNVKPDDDAALDALHARFEGEVKAVIDGMTRAELFKLHQEAIQRFEERIKSARETFDRAQEEWTRQVRAETVGAIDELKATITEELTDMNSFDLMAVQPKAPDLVTFLGARKQGFDRLITSYQDIIEGQRNTPTVPAEGTPLMDEAVYDIPAQR